MQTRRARKSERDVVCAGDTRPGSLNRRPDGSDPFWAMRKVVNPGPTAYAFTAPASLTMRVASALALPDASRSDHPFSTARQET
jgi:hypothetical protein